MRSFNYAVLLLISTLIFSCTDKSDSSVKPGITISPNEEELITTVQIQLRDSNQVILDTIAFNDPDGDGGNAPSIDTIKLQKGNIYFASLSFLDVSNPSAIKDITLEIEAEADEHLICFEQNNLNGMIILKTDSDGTYELGLKSKWILNSSASSNNGILTISLRHQPGIKDGTCAPGNTDVEVKFPVIIN